MLYYERKAKRSGFKFVAGVDEVGRGPLAGPVVACALILKKTRFENLITDSKKLSASRRNSAFHEIIANSFFGLGVVNETVIDKLNIREASRIAMDRAIQDLGKRPDYVLVDGRIDLKSHHNFKNIVRGDSRSLSIAAASIVAKVIRDRIMTIYDKVYPKYGFKDHKGYGTKAHLRAIRRLGPTLIHRLTFRPFKR